MSLHEFQHRGDDCGFYFWVECEDPFETDPDCPRCGETPMTFPTEGLEGAPFTPRPTEVP